MPLVRIAIMSVPSTVITAGCFSMRPDAEDGGLRLVDDRRADHRAEHAGVGDREGALLDLIRAQLLGAGPLAQVVDGAGDAQQRELVGVLDHRHDEPPLERHGDAELMSRRKRVLSPDTAALSTGCFRRLSATAFAMNAR